MTEEPATFDSGSAFRDGVRRARARVPVTTPEAAKALLLEPVETMPRLILTSEECRSPMLGHRRIRSNESVAVHRSVLELLKQLLRKAPLAP